MSYFRNEIDEMQGYTPGEQPRDRRYIKLNTNENPYPPSPNVASFLKNLDSETLRLYPDPVFCELRRKIASLFCLAENEILVGNGSDDILTMAVRSFAGPGRKISSFTPSYSLYPVLSKIQGAHYEEIPLDAQNGFSLPANFAEKVADAALLFVCRPNAPTGNCFPLGAMDRLCDACRGIVLIDEAYADFADDNCIGFPRRHRNAIVMKTLSKSYSLAGLRLGFSIASAEIIAGMMKVKDSYNVSTLAQRIAVAALDDRRYFDETVSKIRRTRSKLITSLRGKGFKVFDSQSNFVFASPPDGDAAGLYRRLKSEGVLVRHFPGASTGPYIRITVGTDTETASLLNLL